MNLYTFIFVLPLLPCTLAIELISGTFIVIGAALSYYYGKDTLEAGLRVLDLAACMTPFKLYECCGKPWIEPNIANLRVDLENYLFGQQIVKDIVPAAIESSIDQHTPTKPLVMSFHGPTGVGKNYVVEFIVQNYFREGLSSKFYHHFESKIDFPYENKFREYQDQLRSWIVGNVTLCPYSVFVFNEVDKMPAKILDGIKPFLDHHSSLNGVDYRRTIFIFISNIGERIITERYLQLWRNQGKKREELTINDFDKVINKGAFNERGGFQMSDVIDHNLIDFYVPFLPLERSHIEQCIVRSMKKLNHTVDNEIMQAVMETMTFSPEPEALFSHSGCKRMDQQVRVHINSKKYRKSFET